MQKNEFCYKFDSKTLTKIEMRLQPDHMNGGFMPKPVDTLYIDPSMIALGEHETLVISDEEWRRTPCYIGTKLYNKIDKTEMIITEVGKAPTDYPEYSDIVIPESDCAYYYDYSDSGWIFNIAKYKTDTCKRVTALCVNENYTMFPQYKRDNVYSGSPATDNYPDYLKGEAGKQSIAKLNAVYQQIATSIQAAINSTDIISREEIDAIISGIVFPTETEILAQIQS